MSTEHIDHTVAGDRTTAFTDIHDIRALTTTGPIPTPVREATRKPSKRTR